MSQPNLIGQTGQEIVYFACFAIATQNETDCRVLNPNLTKTTHKSTIETAHEEAAKRQMLRGGMCSKKPS